MRSEMRIIGYIVQALLCFYGIYSAIRSAEAANKSDHTGAVSRALIGIVAVLIALTIAVNMAP